MNRDDGTPFERMGEYARQRDEAREEANRGYRVQSRDRLRRNAAAKLKTTMIGAISALEAIFGDLWGQGKPRHLLTPEELEMDDRREEFRTRVLNLGNAQTRAFAAEIDQYDVTWARYQYDLMASDDARRLAGIAEDGRVKTPAFGARRDGSIRLRGDD